MIAGGAVPLQWNSGPIPALSWRDEEEPMFWREFRELGRFLRPTLAFGWPWLVLWVAIKTWTWALESRGSDDAIPALVLTIVILARPSYETLWPGTAWQAIVSVVGVAGFIFAVITTWLAPHLAADGIQATVHTPAHDEGYAKTEVSHRLVVYFYLEMAVLTVIAVGSMIIALSRLGPTIETLRSIGQRLLEYWRYRCCQRDPRELNSALARSLTQLICAVLLAFGASKVAIWVNEMEDGGSSYNSAFIANRTGAEMLAEGALYANNGGPQDELICSNFGRYDLIHRIGPGRVDVIPRPLVQISPGAWETQRQKPLQNVACLSASAS